MTVFELDADQDRRSGPGRFLGRSIARRVPVPRKNVRPIVKMLRQRESYYDGGDYGCVSRGIGIRLGHADQSVDFELNCGRIYFTDKGYDGGFSLFSERMMNHWQKLFDQLHVQAP